MCCVQFEPRKTITSSQFIVLQFKSRKKTTKRFCVRVCYSVATSRFAVAIFQKKSFFFRHEISEQKIKNEMAAGRWLNDESEKPCCVLLRYGSFFSPNWYLVLVCLSLKIWREKRRRESLLLSIPLCVWKETTINVTQFPQQLLKCFSPFLLRALLSIDYSPFSYGNNR